MLVLLSDSVSQIVKRISKFTIQNVYFHVILVLTWIALLVRLAKKAVLSVQVALVVIVHALWALMNLKEIV